MVQATLSAPSEQVFGGITDLPPGKIAAVATYLEMRRPVQVAKEPRDPALAFEPIGRDLARYRALYRRIGEPWLWFSRAIMSDAQLRATIEHPDVEALALTRAGRDLGMIELDLRDGSDCELAFLGLVPDAIGGGLGGVLIREAIGRAFARPAVQRLWLHTCTLDHPAAVSFYMRAGLKPYRRAIEIAQDPRLTGHMPAAAAPSFPIV